MPLEMLLGQPWRTRIMTGSDSKASLRSSFSANSRAGAQPLERCEMCSDRAGGGASASARSGAAGRLSAPAMPARFCFMRKARQNTSECPRRIRFLPDFQLTDSQWNGLMMPINMAFFFKSTPQDGRVIAHVSQSGGRH